MQRYVGRVLIEMAYAGFEPTAGRQYLAVPGDVRSSDGTYIAISDAELAARVRGRPRRPGEGKPHTDVVSAARRTLLALGLLAPGSTRLGVLAAQQNAWFEPTYELNLDRVDMDHLGWLQGASTAIYALMRCRDAARIRAELPQLVADLVPLSHFGSEEWRDLVVRHITHYQESPFLCHDWLIPTLAQSPVQRMIVRHVHRGSPMPSTVQPAPPRPVVAHVSPVVFAGSIPAAIPPDDPQQDLFGVAVEPTSPVAAPPPVAPETDLDASQGWEQLLNTPYTDQQLLDMFGPDWDNPRPARSDTGDGTSLPGPVVVEADETSPILDALVDAPEAVAAPESPPAGGDTCVVDKATITALCVTYWETMRTRTGRDLYAEPAAVKGRQHKQLRDIIRWALASGVEADDVIPLLIDVITETQLTGDLQRLAPWVPSQGYVQTHLLRRQGRSSPASVVEQERLAAERGRASHEPPPDTADVVVIPRWAREAEEAAAAAAADPQVRVGAR